LAAAAAQDGPTGFGLHTGAETELLLARALGRLISAFHILKIGDEMLRMKSKTSIQKICHTLDLDIEVTRKLCPDRSAGWRGLAEVTGIDRIHLLEIFL